MSLRFRIVFALACALLAALLCAVYAQHVQAETERTRSEALARYGGEVVSVVVAARNLSSGDEVAADDVETAEWVADLVPEGAFTDIDDVVGSRLSSSVPAGSVLCALHFEAEEGASQIPEGHVAISLSVSDRLGLPSEAGIGSRLLAYTISDGSASLIADDIELLSHDSSSQYGTQSVTLAVLPDQVASILSASSAGDLRLAVPADDVDAGSTGISTAPTSVPATAQEGNPS